MHGQRKLQDTQYTAAHQPPVSRLNDMNIPAVVPKRYDSNGRQKIGETYLILSKLGHVKPSPCGILAIDPVDKPIDR